MAELGSIRVAESTLKLVRKSNNWRPSCLEWFPQMWLDQKVKFISKALIASFKTLSYGPSSFLSRIFNFKSTAAPTPEVFFFLI